MTTFQTFLFGDLVLAVFDEAKLSGAHRDDTARLSAIAISHILERTTSTR